MQRPIDGLHHDETITGVPVTLTALDSDGNYVDIGTTTSNGYYGNFGLEWTPSEEGTYEILASFAGDRYFSSSTAVADHGKGAVAMSNGYWLAWDLRTGNLAWKSEVTDLPWGMWWPYSVSSAYGMIIDGTYAGMYAFDWDDGSIVWKYKDPTSYDFETPYIDEEGNGVNSFNSGAFVADGKLYTLNSEHTTTEPVTRGWKIHCIDAYTGDGIWNMTGAMSPGAVADGYLTASSSYDGYMYIFGKGKTATTVTAPDIVIVKSE